MEVGSSVKYNFWKLSGSIPLEGNIFYGVIVEIIEPGLYVVNTFIPKNVDDEQTILEIIQMTICDDYLELL